MKIPDEYMEMAMSRNPLLRITETLKRNNLPWSLLSDDEKSAIFYVWDNSPNDLKQIVRIGDKLHTHDLMRYMFGKALAPKDEYVFIVDPRYYPCPFLETSFPHPKVLEGLGYELTGEFRIPRGEPVYVGRMVGAAGEEVVSARGWYMQAWILRKVADK